MEIVFTYAASKHGISHQSIRHVIEHCGLPLKQPAPPNAPRGHNETRWLYLGDDEDGTALEVMAVELQSGARLVIHAMPLRDQYLERYERGKQWRI